MRTGKDSLRSPNESEYMIQTYPLTQTPARPSELPHASH